MTGPLVLPAPQAFSSVGQLYPGIERGLRGLVDRYGKGKSSCASVGGCMGGVGWVDSVESGRAPAGRAGRHERAKAATR